MLNIHYLLGELRRFFMKKNKKKILLVLSGFLSVSMLGFIVGDLFFNLGIGIGPNIPPVQLKVIPTISVSQEISYQGENGKNALLLLRKKASVEQDTSGLVVSINGRKSNAEKREYWAFYVNGKLASVGPAQYNTTNQDSIEWKIETY